MLTPSLGACLALKEEEDELREIGLDELGSTHSG